MEKIEICQSVKSLRVDNGVTLRELSRLTGISAAYLVSVEKGSSSPTIATLSKILKALGSDLATFFAKMSGEPEESIFRSSEMQSVKDAHRTCTFLLPKRSDMRFELLNEIILPFESETEWEMHDCDLGGVIISGSSAELEIENIGKWPLKKGDSFYVKANQKHRLINKGRGKLELITVMDPPRY
ncbi:MAG: helix-turn-helix domain-containing protein [Sedimentisphaeraceae bacterium JB056]